jgi:hypothetical protein
MGIANIINTSTSSGGGGGEIIRELVNSSDGQGLYFSNTGYIHLANNAAVEFGTSDFSIEFILNQTGEAGTSGGSIYQSATTVNNKFSIENHVNSNVVKLIFFNAVGAASQYDLPYNMAADYNEPTHYVVSCDRSGNAVLYRNGTEVASVSIAASASTNLGDGVTSTAMIGNSGSGYTFLGGLYRFRTWNKALSHDEVDTCFQRADVPFESQYGSETSLVDANASTFVGTSTYGWVKYGNNTIANTSNQLVITYVDNVEGAYNYLKNSTDLTTDLTVGKKYKIKIDAKYAGGSAGVKLKIHDGASNTEFGTLTTSLTTYEVEFTAQSTSGAYIKLGDMSASNVVTLDNFYVYTCGVLTDHDLAFANPTQSAMCQDRAGNSDGTMGGTIQQTQKIVQLNSTAIAVSAATARTPADGDIIADKIGVDCTPTVPLDVVGVAQFLATGSYGLKLHGSNGNQSGILDTYGNHDLEFRVNNSKKMVIDTSGNVTVDGGDLKLKAPAGNQTDAELLFESPNNSSFGSTFVIDSKILSTANSTTNAYGSRLKFFTNNNSNALTERMSIDSAGLVSIPATGADQKRSLNIHGTNGSSEQQTLTIESDGENALCNLKLGIGGGAASTKMTISSGGNVIIPRAQDTTTGTPFSNAALKLLPSATTNITGLSSLALSTSTADNYGFLISGHRAASSGTPTLRISSHNNSSTGAEVLNITNAGMMNIGPTHGGVTFENTSSVTGSTVLQQTYSGSNPELRIGSNVSTGATSAMNIRSGDAGLVTFNGGINFTQTNTQKAGASTTAAIFNHYEEGTWTPQFNAGTPFTSTPAMEILSAVYTRIGNLVYIQAYIRTDNVDATGAAGVLRITGLPFTSASSNKYGSISIAEAGSFVSSKFPAGGYVNTGATHITLTKRPTAGGSLLSCQFDSLTTGVTANQNSLLFSGTYTV